MCKCDVLDTCGVLEVFLLQLKSHLFLSYRGIGTKKNYDDMCYQIYQNHHSLYKHANIHSMLNKQNYTLVYHPPCFYGVKRSGVCS